MSPSDGQTVTLQLQGRVLITRSDGRETKTQQRPKDVESKSESWNERAWGPSAWWGWESKILWRTQSRDSESHNQKNETWKVWGDLWERRSGGVERDTSWVPSSADGTDLEFLTAGETHRPRGERRSGTPEPGTWRLRSEFCDGDSEWQWSVNSPGCQWKMAVAPVMSPPPWPRPHGHDSTLLRNQWHFHN